VNVGREASLLVTGVIVVDPATGTATAPQDILIENGHIARMAPAGTVAARTGR
jgi:predicted amidohydrolase